MKIKGTIVDPISGNYNVENVELTLPPYVSDIEPGYCRVRYSPERTGAPERTRVGAATKFDSLEEAVTSFQQLYWLNSKSKAVANPYHVVKTTMGHAYVIMEELIPITNWSTFGNLWKRNKVGKIIGLGQDFISVLGKILNALREVHEECGLRHGNLKSGVSFAADHTTIKLHSFCNNCVDLEGKYIIQDFEALLELCGDNVFNRVPQHDHSEDVALFREFFSFEQYKSLDPKHESIGPNFDLGPTKNIAKFLYHLPLFWSVSVVGNLFRFLGILEKVPRFQCFFVQIDFERHYPTELSWWAKIPYGSELMKTLFFSTANTTFIVPPFKDLFNDKIQGGMPDNSKYHKPSGIAPFSSNALEHAGFPHGVHLIMKTFPAINLKLFLELLRIPAMNMPIEVTADKTIPFHHYISEEVIQGVATRWYNYPELAEETPICFS